MKNLCGRWTHDKFRLALALACALSGGLLLELPILRWFLLHWICIEVLGIHHWLLSGLGRSEVHFCFRSTCP